jgi:glycosyltransferase involved in cell wall biosynthesis
MVYPLIREMIRRRMFGKAHWVSLNSQAPDEVSADNITLHHIKLEPDKVTGYGYTKEVIWNVLHGTGQEATSPDGVLWQDEYPAFVFYNRLTAEQILKLDHENDFDVFYIHDFQQLPIGHMLHSPKPCIFRWHIPFDESMIPLEWKGFLSTYLNSYDVIIVSCKKYLDSLRSFGYTGNAKCIRPYLDINSYSKPTGAQMDELCHNLNIHDDDRIILTVARLDPMKGQDRVIKAISEVRRDFPDAKLLLVGNGSFSSSKSGLGLNKAEGWREELRRISGELLLKDNVIFAGHLNEKQLCAAYERCDMTVLPSIREGFGLVVVESWLFKKPAIVSSRAGIAEMIKDGENGITFDTNCPLSLAEKITSLLRNPSLGRTIGENGFATSRNCSMEYGVKEESEVIGELMS